MNAITLIWRQVLKELKLFQMKENKEDAVEKTDKEPQKTLKCHEDKYTVPLPDTAPPTGREKETERKQPVRLTQEVRTFLQKQYDFRYNLLTEETEYRPANKRAVPFEPVSKRELNTFCMEASKSRGIFFTCNSPGTGGVYWRPLACPVAFCHDKAACFRPFLRRFFHVPALCLFLVFHFRMRVREVFLFRFPFRAPAPFFLFLLYRIEPPGNTPQRFCHAAACLPETYLAKLSPEYELVHEQIGEQ